MTKIELKWEEEFSLLSQNLTSKFRNYDVTILYNAYALYEETASWHYLIKDKLGNKIIYKNGFKNFKEAENACLESLETIYRGENK